MWASLGSRTLAISLLFSSGGQTADLPAFQQPILDGMSTCPSQTINYITHSLPQQCLRTGWSSEAAFSKEPRDRPPLDDFQHKTIISASASATAAVLDGGIGSAGSTSSPADPIASSSSGTEFVSTAAEASTIPHKTEATEVPPAEAEADILSDAPSFLSFEEWKAQMLAKAGQSPEDVRGRPSNSQGHDMRRRPGSINSVLDSLGDDAEIELDFRGFVNEDTASSVLPRKPDAATEPQSVSDRKEDPKQPSTEAGTTSKERFNYASFDCAATILKQNTECKGVSAVLSENRDTYMLNICSAKNKFFIVELCNDILIDTIVLANFEYFSSTFRTFRVSISDRYPVKLEKWRDIGTFEARNARGLQVFLVENGLIWARYLRIEFLTHFGSEYYCPVSLLRVHGKTMMDDWRNDVKAAKGEDDLEEAEHVQPGELTAEPLQAAESATATKWSAETNPSDAGIPTASPSAPGPAENISSAGAESMSGATSQTCGSPLLDQFKRMTETCSSTTKQCPLDVDTGAELATNSSITSAASATPQDISSGYAPRPSANLPLDRNETISKLPEAVPSTEIASASIPAISEESNKTTTSTAATTKKDQQSTAGPTKTTQQASPTPSTQESFFKSVHKRLQHLEANSTLSLQYIEEQSRILREAFSKGQKQQLGKTTAFLDSLNVTVLGELQNFRLQYDQIWQSTVLELSAQREQSQREIVALTTRLGALADEMLLQKRLVILQFVLILLCLGLVLFSRSSSTAVLDLPSAVHNMVAKPSKPSRYLQFESPSASPSRPSSRYGLLAGEASPFPGLSNESTMYDDGMERAAAAYAPPTPMSESSANEGDERSVSTESPEPNMAMRRANSTPASLALLNAAESTNNVHDATVANTMLSGNLSSNRGQARDSPPSGPLLTS